MSKTVAILRSHIRHGVLLLRVASTVLLFTLAADAQLSSPTFTFSVSPTLASVIPGDSTSFILSMSSMNGFAGRITLGARGYPSGNAGFTPSSVSLASDETATVTVTISPNRNAALQSYSITFIGDSGSVHQEASAR